MLHVTQCPPTDAYSFTSAWDAGSCSIRSMVIAACFAHMQMFGAHRGNQKNQSE